MRLRRPSEAVHHDWRVGLGGIKLRKLAANVFRIEHRVNIARPRATFADFIADVLENYAVVAIRLSIVDGLAEQSVVVLFDIVHNVGIAKARINWQHCCAFSHVDRLLDRSQIVLRRKLFVPVDLSHPILLAERIFPLLAGLLIGWVSVALVDTASICRLISVPACNLGIGREEERLTGVAVFEDLAAHRLVKSFEIARRAVI